MDYKIGDLLEMSTGKFMVVKGCIIEEKEYYLLYNADDMNMKIIIEKEKNSDDIKYIKERNKIEEALRGMVEQK